MKAALVAWPSGYRIEVGGYIFDADGAEALASRIAALAAAARANDARDAALPFVDRVALYVARASQVAPTVIASGLDATLGDVEAALRTLVTAGRAVPVAHFDSPMYRAAHTAPRT